MDGKDGPFKTLSDLSVGHTTVVPGRLHDDAGGFTQATLSTGPWDKFNYKYYGQMEDPVESAGHYEGTCREVWNMIPGKCHLGVLTYLPFHRSRYFIG